MIKLAESSQANTSGRVGVVVATPARAINFSLPLTSVVAGGGEPGNEAK